MLLTTIAATTSRTIGHASPVTNAPRETAETLVAETTPAANPSADKPQSEPAAEAHD